MLRTAQEFRTSQVLCIALRLAVEGQQALWLKANGDTHQGICLASAPGRGRALRVQDQSLGLLQTKRFLLEYIRDTGKSSQC